ncbi:hypothetical protein ANCCEY_02461 [Ancylostoma ceylanicum]|uniref:Sulfotransferase domain-containing protein n=1 Tax=Ancylostoma ceylanicum TaxID=53326 RepID=A0A0D6M7V0_9BILA|nr:hypothetical protein ANCCEY_02461 [Ancylostoma ceylanicum]
MSEIDENRNYAIHLQEISIPKSGKTSAAKICEVDKVASKYHLAGCVIEKNFSTMLTAILCYLFDEARFTEHNRNITAEVYHKRFCKAQNEHDSLASLRSELNVDLKGWSLIAVVRDPLERFVSGYANKCLRRCEFSSHLHDYQILKFDTFNPQGFIDRLLAIFKKHKVQDDVVVEEAAEKFRSETFDDSRRI